MEKIKKIFLFLGCLGILFLGGFFARKNDLSSLKPYVKINKQIIRLEIAQTPEQRAQGLSDRDSLAENQGMLFIFDRLGNYPFWMNRMKFNLDFVFFKDNEVIEIVANVPYPKNGEKPQRVLATKPFDKVLELNDGIAQKLGLKKGDKVIFNLGF